MTRGDCLFVINQSSEQYNINFITFLSFLFYSFKDLLLEDADYAVAWGEALAINTNVTHIK